VEQEDRTAEVVRVVPRGGACLHVHPSERNTGISGRPERHVTIYGVEDCDDTGADGEGGLEEFVPTAHEAIELVNGRVCLVDGTITPCWSYGDHDELWSRKHGTTGLNAQLVCLLDGAAIYISDPLPGKTHDATAFVGTPVA